MKTPICEQYGIEFPLFAFSHCRDVVAAVTNAGGLGVLGGVAFRPDQLEQELCWIDEHVNGKPYGVDIIVPAKFEGKGENLSFGQLAERIPSCSPTTTSRSRRSVSGPRRSQVTPARVCWTSRSITRSR
jgi:hypothetical protein